MSHVKVLDECRLSRQAVGAIATIGDNMVACRKTELNPHDRRDDGPAPS